MVQVIIHNLKTFFKIKLQKQFLLFLGKLVHCVLRNILESFLRNFDKVSCPVASNSIQEAT